MKNLMILALALGLPLTASAFDITPYAVVSCETTSDCVATVPIYQKQNKATCELSYNAAYAGLNRTNKLITNLNPCDDTKIDYKNGREAEVHTGNFQGSISFR